MHRGLPFEVKIPNDETIAAMEEEGAVVEDIDAFFDEILEAADNEKTH
jgi:antitoxin component of RelBE/YafQ-DinJ toxin-antitoxin module